MCLAVKKGTRKKVAKEDIVVYKELNHYADDGLYYSIYQSFAWEVGKTYTTTIKRSDETQFFDSEDREIMEKTPCSFYGEGFHSVGHPKRLNYKGRYSVVAECVIPEGSKYIRNESDLYISNALKIVRIL